MSRAWPWRALLCVLVALPYLRGVFTNGFVWLDRREIVEGGLIVSSWSELAAVFGDDRNFAGYHRPLYTLAHSLDRALFGLEPAGFLATSLALHVLAALLLMLLMEELGTPRPIAFAAALLFGLHPLNAVVAGLIHSKADSLTLVFGLAATRWVVRGARATDGRGRGPWLLALGALALALLSKELAFVLPLLWLVLGWSTRASITPAVRARGRGFLACAFALAGAALWLRFAEARGTYDSPASLLARLTTFGAVYVDDARQLLLPLERKIADTVTVFPARPLGAQAVLVVLFTALVVLQVQVCQRAPRVGRWLVALNLCLLPVAQVVPILHFRADRFLYAPSACLCGALAEAATAAWHARPGRSLARVAGASLAALALFAGLVVERRTRSFRDDAALFEPELARRPDYREGAAALALHYDEHGEPERAALLWHRAHARQPEVLSYVDRDALVVGMSRNYLLRGLPGDALHFLEAELPAMQGEDHRHHARFNLGVAALRLGRGGVARAAFEAYRERAPEDPEGHLFCARAAEAEGDLAGALAAYRAYLELDVGDVERASVEDRAGAIEAALAERE